MPYILPTTIKRIPPEEERELVRCAKQGDILARNKLFEAHLPFIIHWVKNRVSPGHPFYEDLIQEGVLGDCVGIERFDLNKRDRRGNLIRYGAYGYWWVRQSIEAVLAESNTWNNFAVSLNDDLIVDEDVDSDREIYYIESSFRIRKPPPQDEFSAPVVHPRRSVIAKKPEHMILCSAADVLEELKEGGLIQGLDFVEFMLSLVNGELTPKQREILRQHYNGGLSNVVIGRLIGHTGRWVGVLRVRAINMLKDRLREISNS